MARSLYIVSVSKSVRVYTFSLDLSAATAHSLLPLTLPPTPCHHCHCPLPPATTATQLLTLRWSPLHRARRFHETRMFTGSPMLFLFLVFTFTCLSCVLVCGGSVGEHTCATVPTWRSGDNLQESVLASHLLNPGDQTRAVRLENKVPSTAEPALRIPDHIPRVSCLAVSSRVQIRELRADIGI